MKMFLALIMFLLAQVALANELTAKLSGPGQKTGSLGSYLASCSATYEGNFEEWQTRFTIEKLQFECNDRTHLIFPKMDFDVKNGQAISGEITGTISEGLVTFNFPQTSSEYRIKIHAKENGVFIQVKLVSNLGLMYSFETLLRLDK